MHGHEHHRIAHELRHRSLSMRGDLTDLVGRTLARRYEVVRPIGQGGMGVVFEAIQLDLGRPVALKVLFDDDPRAIARFRQEATATAKLRSPNVVAITELVEPDDAPPFLVMELLDGEPLGRLLAREKKLPPSRAVGIAVQVLSALAQAHALGLVHRDIKPSNVFLVRTPSGGDVVKVLDFGVAKVLEGGMKTTTGAILGTPAYLAPEQILSRVVGPAADLHAVGVLLYEMLTGTRPWRSSDVIASIAYVPASALDGVPPSLAAAVAKALAKDPAARHASAEAMINALKEALEPPPSPSPSRRRPAALFAIAFVSTGAVAVAGVLIAARARQVEAPPPPIATVVADAAPVAVPAPTESVSTEPVVVDAAVPPKPAPARAPVLDSECVCLAAASGGFRRGLCQGQQVPRCECLLQSNGLSMLCNGPFAPDAAGAGTCPGGYNTFGGTGKKNGDPCQGHRHIGDMPMPGTLSCNFCYEPRGVSAVHGTACTGIWQDGLSHVGTWDCLVRRR